jgi:hypothetical protein
MIDARVRFHRCIRNLNAFQGINRYALANQLFNASQHATLFRIAQRNRNTRRTSSTRSSDAMHVGFFFCRHVMIENM